MATGIMQMQAAGLSEDDRKSVAAFLSQAQIPDSAGRGLCSATEIASVSPVRIADWGMSAENARAVNAGATSITPVTLRD